MQLVDPKNVKNAWFKPKKEKQVQAQEDTILPPFGESTCVVCLEDFEEGQATLFLPCLHVLCSSCAGVCETCPSCRNKIDEKMKVSVRT